MQYGGAYPSSTNFPRWNSLLGCALRASRTSFRAFFRFIFKRIGRSDGCIQRVASHNYGAIRSGTSQEGWLSPVEGTRLEIERGVKLTVGSNPTPSDSFLAFFDALIGNKVTTSNAADGTISALRLAWLYDHDGTRPVSLPIFPSLPRCLLLDMLMEYLMKILPRTFLRHPSKRHDRRECCSRNWLDFGGRRSSAGRATVS